MRPLLYSCLILATSVLSFAHALDIGDKAPSVNAVPLVKGESVDFAQQVTVVEFWATWCGPCKESIPHLSKIQAQYGDSVRVIGLSDEDLPTVQPWVAEQGDTMAYTVGLIGPELRDIYMENVSGIPYAYIVGKDGVIQWSGHPLGMDGPLAKVVAGEWDMEQAKTIKAAEARLEESFRSRDMEIIGNNAKALLQIDPVNDLGLRVQTQIAHNEDQFALYVDTFSSIDLESLDEFQTLRILGMLLQEERIAWRQPRLLAQYAAKVAEQGKKDDAMLLAAARAHYQLADIDSAIALAEKALAIKADDETKAILDFYNSIKAFAEK